VGPNSRATVGRDEVSATAPDGAVIVNFVCIEQKLVVELDGGQHADQQDADARRTAWLESQGYRVLRFWNNQALENPEGVLLEIQQALRNRP